MPATLAMLTTAPHLFRAMRRVLGVTAVADDLPKAIRLAYEAADHIRFDGLHRREDIGARALKALG